LLAECRRQAAGIVLSPHRIDRAQRGNRDFTRRHAGDQATTICQVKPIGAINGCKA
jgi:hypothetical protein